MAEEKKDLTPLDFAALLTLLGQQEDDGAQHRKRPEKAGPAGVSISLCHETTLLVIRLDSYFAFSSTHSGLNLE